MRVKLWAVEAAAIGFSEPANTASVETQPIEWVREGVVYVPPGRAVWILGREFGFTAGEWLGTLCPDAAARGLVAGAWLRAYTLDVVEAPLIVAVNAAANTVMLRVGEPVICLVKLRLQGL